MSLAQNQDVARAARGRHGSTRRWSRWTALDAWRLAHPASTLRRAAYTHPLRINIGFVALGDAAELVAAADRAIGRAAANGDLQRWSEQTGTTWVAPVEPAVAATIGLSDLVRE